MRASQRFDEGPLDPVSSIGNVDVLCIITLVLCWLTARHAAGLDPAVVVMEQ